MVFIHSRYSFVADDFLIITENCNRIKYKKLLSTLLILYMKINNKNRIFNTVSRLFLSFLQQRKIKIPWDNQLGYQFESL